MIMTDLKNQGCQPFRIESLVNGNKLYLNYVMATPSIDDIMFFYSTEGEKMIGLVYKDLIVNRKLLLSIIISIMIIAIFFMFLKFAITVGNLKNSACSAHKFIVQMSIFWHNQKANK